MVKTGVNIPQALMKIKQDEVLKTINALACEHRIKIYLAGGAVRDVFTRRKRPRGIEWDFAVDHNALGFGKILARKLSASYVVLDADTRTARVIYNTPGCGYELDITDFRARTLREDLRRRDFTINALCCDVRKLVGAESPENLIIDPWGGIADIRRGCIRVTRRQNIADDPLRILRGIAFCAQLDFTLEPKTRAVMKKNTVLLRRVSPERIREELAKILEVPRAFKHSKIMDCFGIWPVIIPETRLLRGVDQGGYHHLDVWGHSLQTLAQLERILRDSSKKLPPEAAAYLQETAGADRPKIWLLKLACLLHDIAKPATRFVGDNGQVHFYTHEKKGAHIAANIGRRLKLTRKEVRILQRLVLYHLRAGQLVNRIPSKRAKFRFFRDAADEAGMILLLALADRRAMRGPLSRPARFTFLEEELFAMIAEFFKQRKSSRGRVSLLNGHAVMRLLNLPAGPVIGKMLRAVQEAQAVKAIRSAEEARRLVCRLYRQECRGAAAEQPA